MPEMTRPLDAVTGAGETPSHFGALDMSYRLRMRAFVEICMPPIFASLNARLKMMSLRKKGIAQIMFYLDFASGPTPIAFGRKLSVQHTMKLHRSITDDDNRPARSGTERLLLDSRSVIRGQARSHGADSLGFDDGSGAILEAGKAEILHIITKPVAPPGERQVTIVPEELRVLKEHPWEQPLPSVEGLSVVPEGYERVDAHGWEERQGVWGLPNTDINQHVNVQEYIMGGENQFAHLLYGGKLPVARHRLSRARLLFRKPSFPGQAYVIRSQLYRRGALTQMHAAFHAIENDQPAERASTYVVYDGEIEM